MSTVTDMKKSTMQIIMFMATTGGHSPLLGETFGQFDHISWITMSEDGPIMANLKLDGILPHDIATVKTRALAAPLVSKF